MLNKQCHWIQSYFFQIDVSSEDAYLLFFFCFVLFFRYYCRFLLGVKVPIVLQSASSCHCTGSRQMAKG